MSLVFECKHFAVQHVRVIQKQVKTEQNLSLFFAMQGLHGGAVAFKPKYIYLYPSPEQRTN